MKKILNVILFFVAVIFIQFSLAYGATVKIIPAVIDVSTVGVGGTFDVTVNVEDVSDLAAFEFIISYDPAILIIADSSHAVLGDFLKDVTYFMLTENSLNNLKDNGSVPDYIINELQGVIYEIYANEEEFAVDLKEKIGEEESAKYESVIWESRETLTRKVSTLLPISIDNNTGKLKMSLFSYGDAPGLSGSGILAKVAFTVKSLACGTLNLNSVQLTNPKGNPISDTEKDAEIICSSCIELYTVTFTAVTGGEITGEKDQSIESGNCTTEVTAVSDNCYKFTGWSGDYTGTDNPLKVCNIAKNMNIIANFKSLSGDINGDKVVDLKDAILILKMLCGISISEQITITSCTDINGDGKIGFEEVLYILQKITSVR